MKGCDKMAASKKYASRDCGVFELTNLATSKKALRVDYANTVTLNITADSVKAKKRGRDAVTFANPMEGTLESEIQVYPFELFSIFGNGTITEGGDRAEMKTITATEAGKLTLPDDPKAVALRQYRYRGSALIQITDPAPWSAPGPCRLFAGCRRLNQKHAVYR